MLNLNSFAMSLNFLLILKVVRDSFRPEEETVQSPQPTLRFQPQFQVDTDVQSRPQTQTQLQLQDQFQQQPQTQPPPQPLRHGPFQQHQFQSAVNFDNLVKVSFLRG